ncbi:FapA family protein [Treponema pedis]|uniref:RNA-binding protein KhpB N-terminal domain-containing protein n=12 Tax=Treponema pedis TaxID=409322 RepID=S6A820_9SPIR|nr:FapA family protein [Treponema pedis]AGT43069.1 hypothetical protein TPE_0573 [Treponema pedis str. T A4]QSI03916.1 DUF342 domain-containing protein [Treponema pedis]
MIRLNQIKEKMTELHELDSGRFFIDTSGDTLDEALLNASVQLGVPMSSVDYEILQKGVSGFFALFPKEWKIRAYETSKPKKASPEEGEISETDNMEEGEVIPDQDGMAYIFCAADGIYLKVTAPSGYGNPATIHDAIEKLRDRALPIPEDNILKPIINARSGEYVKIAPYTRIPGNDATMAVTISEDEMKAYLYVNPPSAGGVDLSADTIIAFLKNNRVIVGINEDLVKQFQDSPVYKEDYLVAEGIEPKDGEDARIEYDFEVDNTRVRLQETHSGQINFKELNLIQNVVEGQPVAHKIPAQRGKAGKTVTGKYLEASNGKDVPLPLGKNTKVAPDGLTIIAEVNGQVLLVKNKVTVQEIYVVEGDVSIRTGNITFLGSVFVNGNVDDGFVIKASGNIEVKGTVGKAELDTEGDIVVSQGIIGKEGGAIRAGKSIWSKFIQNTEIVEAGDMVVVSDGIINSNVIANRKIICQGKRADIIGGNLSASESISARNLGSASGGNDTVLNVGFDPKSKERLNFLLQKQEMDEKSLDEVKLNLASLEETKSRRGELPKDKEETYKKMSDYKYTIETEIHEVQKEITQIREYLNTLKNQGRVSASGHVYAGVRIVIRDTVEDVRADCKATTFYLDRSIVRYGKYQQDTDEDVKRVPSGYSSN